MADRLAGIETVQRRMVLGGVGRQRVDQRHVGEAVRRSNCSSRRSG